MFTTAPRAPADANCSGELDLGDALLALRVLAGLDSGATCGGVIDADLDGFTTADDALAILRRLVGLE